MCCQRLNVSSDTIKRWKKEFNQGKLKDTPPEKSKEEEKLIQLRKELSDVKMKREYLKKGSWHLLQEQQVKYKFIRCYKSEFSVEKMCSIFKVSK